MIFIDRISNAPKQSYTLNGPNNEQIKFFLWYAPSQQTWFFSIQYLDITIRGLQFVVGPNILRNYRNLIPFGLAVTSIDGLDPLYISDFTVGRISAFLLSQAEVDEIEDNYFRAVA